MNHYTLKLIVTLCILVISISHAEAARKGRANSDEREAWCSSKLHDCVKDANDSCSETYGEGNTQDSLCKSSEVNVCKNSYGSSSDCLTRDRRSRPSNKAVKVGTNEKVIATPSSSKDPKKKNLQQKLLMKSPSKAKNKSITADE